MVVEVNKLINPQCQISRLLVLGDKQVGKSAAVVRYTTGRFIHDYSSTTSNWIYKHNDTLRDMQASIEIIEQEHLQSFRLDDFRRSSTAKLSSDGGIFHQAHNIDSRATRPPIAVDVGPNQQFESEIIRKRKLLDKLRWADAYIVIYAINDASSFERAIEYLNLLSSFINSARHSDLGDKLCNINRANSISRKRNIFRNRLSNSKKTKPVLLLANKKDLENEARQVSTNDGLMLAIRHHVMFAELSIADSNRTLQSNIRGLIESINSKVTHDDQSKQSNGLQSVLVTSTPKLERALYQASVSVTCAPVIANLVKSEPVRSAVISNKDPLKNHISKEANSITLRGSIAQSAEVSQADKLLSPSTATLLKPARKKPKNQVGNTSVTITQWCKSLMRPKSRKQQSHEIESHPEVVTPTNMHWESRRAPSSIGSTSTSSSNF